MAQGRLKNPIILSSLELKIKKKVREHLRMLGYRKRKNGQLEITDTTKDGVRRLHSKQREEKIMSSREFIDKKLPLLMQHFASGHEISVANIRPRLEGVNYGTWQSDLFRLASLTWSVPISQGYGRRMRFLVWDDYNEKLIGLIALGDPVFNLKARDEYIGWNSEVRTQNLVNIMDAFVLGALPPYNMLLGGKLIASLVRTREIKEAFENKYKNNVGVISGEKKNPSLVAVTTSSALGKSSVYNRLKLNNKTYFKPLGYTAGWGHFHISDELFVDIRKYLEEKEHRYASNHEFGEGPNWRLRTVKAAFQMLGIGEDVLKHGINREVFICELAENISDYLIGRAPTPLYPDLLNFSQVSELAINRWMINRAYSKPEYRYWDKRSIQSLLSTNQYPILNKANIVR